MAAAVATVVTIAVMERGRWSIGVLVPPQLAARDLFFGLLFAGILIGFADLIVLASTSLRHARGSGFPWSELWIVFAPAAIHEEVVFRGYLFQRIRVWNRGAAIGASSIVFAGLHGSYRGIVALAVINLLLAGVLLCLAYERYTRLWFPIGIHLGWNVLSGPVLGYAVSGFESPGSVLRLAGSAPGWVSGGEFGIEGSVIATLVEAIGITVLFLSREKRLERHRHR